MNEKIIYNLGLFEKKTVEEQLNEQGLTLGRDAKLVEKLRESFHIFRFHIFTEKQEADILKKIQKLIGKSIKKLQGSNSKLEV